MAKNVTLRDANDEIVYPQTLVSQVSVDGYTSLEGLLDVKGNTRTFYETKHVATTDWVNNTNGQASESEREEYPYMATISIDSSYGVTTQNTYPNVIFGYDEQVSQNFAPSSYTITDGVIIEAKEKPTSQITINILFTKMLDQIS